MSCAEKTGKDPRVQVYILRHGVTSGNEEGKIVGHIDLGLSPKGREQALGARQLIANCPIDRAITSPLKRTRETAEIVLEGRSIEARPEPGLIELALKGWEGKTRHELRDDPDWQRWLTVPHTLPTPEGEWLEDVSKRAVASMTKTVKELANASSEPNRGGVAIFTHGGVARILILHLLGLPLSAYQKLRCDCASVSAFELTPEATLARVLALNLTVPPVCMNGTPVH